MKRLTNICFGFYKFYSNVDGIRGDYWVRAGCARITYQEVSLKSTEKYIVLYMN